MRWLFKQYLPKMKANYQRRKDELVEDYEVENESYMENSTKVQAELEELIEKAEEILAEARQGPVNPQPASQPATDTAVSTADATQSAPHSYNINDLRPIHPRNQIILKNLLLT